MVPGGEKWAVGPALTHLPLVLHSPCHPLTWAQFGTTSVEPHLLDSKAGKSAEKHLCLIKYCPGNKQTKRKKYLEI